MRNLSERDVHFIEDPEYDLGRPWFIVCDLTRFGAFKSCSSNHEVAKILLKFQIAQDNDHLDPEFDCLYASFKTKADALNFLGRLNTHLKVGSHG